MGFVFKAQSSKKVCPLDIKSVWIVKMFGLTGSVNSIWSHCSITLTCPIRFGGFSLWIFGTPVAGLQTHDLGPEWSL